MRLGLYYQGNMELMYKKKIRKLILIFFFVMEYKSTDLKHIIYIIFFSILQYLFFCTLATNIKQSIPGQLSSSLFSVTCIRVAHTVHSLIHNQP